MEWQWQPQGSCKLFSKFNITFQTSNTQWSYQEDAFDQEKGDDKTIKQLDVHLTNALFKCGYVQG